MLLQLQEQLDAILNPNNVASFLPHTSNYSLRQIGNTFEIVFRGDQATTSIRSLNTTSLTGSAVLQTRTSGINYYGFSIFNLTLGSGNDSLNIQGTAAGTTTNLNTAAGNDQIDMSSAADLTGTTDLIAGDVNLDAGSGTNRLLISDAADTTGDTSVSLTRNVGTATETLTLSGIADGDIRFSATGGNFNQGVTIFGGSGGNRFTVDGAFAHAPTLIGTGAGNDHLTLTSFTAADGSLKIQGQAGNDVLNASAAAGSLIIDGNAGNDAIAGGSGHDTLRGGAGTDYIRGNAGDDTITGDNSHTIDIFGNDTPDVLAAGTGDSDIIVGGSGSDTLTSEGGNDIVFGDEGTVTDTTLIGSDSGADGNDTIRTGDGNDIVIGGLGNDDIQTGTGDAIITGGIASFIRDLGGLTVVGELASESTGGQVRTITSHDTTDGDDTIVVTQGTNVILGGLGQDHITADGGINTVLGDNGQAVFFADGVLQLVRSTDPGNGAHDEITLLDGTNTVIGGAGADTISIGGGTNVVLGDEGGMEVLTDGNGDPTGTTVIASSNVANGGNDTINVGPGVNIVIGGAGNDEITAGAGTNTILGDDGKATFFVNGDLQLIESTNLGSGDADTITLEDGTNTVIAGAGNDIIHIGGGTNVVLGDEGKREVQVDIGGVPTGTTVIESLNDAVGGDDTINAGPGVNILVGGAATDTITVLDSSPTSRATVLGDSGSMTLANDGTLLTIESSTPVSGARDIIHLTSGVNTVIGGAGNDEITAGAGTNTILGDDGKATFFVNGDLQLIESTNLGSGDADTITLEDGTNTVIAGAGNDIIHIGGGTNVVLGDEGKREVQVDIGGVPTGTTVIESLNDAVGGDDTINAGPGVNILVGGAATDTITVLDSSPTSRATVLGDSGSMTLANDRTLLTIESSTPVSGARDIIHLTSGVNTVIGGAGNDEITATTGRNTVLGDDGHATFYANGDLKFIESINLGNGGSDTISLQSGINAVIAGAGNDTVSVNDGTNVILGDEGEASLYTDGNVDEIRSTNSGVGGTDTITLGNGTNIVIAGAGADSVSVGAGTATILGDEGRSVVARDMTTHAITARIVETINDAIGGNDAITGTGATSIVMGGAGSDTITGTTPGTASPPRFIVIGDAGRTEFNGSGQLLQVFTKSANTGAGDTIHLANADDLILGGDGGDIIDAAEGINIVLGDHGHATFDVTGLRTIHSSDTASGGHDAIRTGSGNDLIIAGTGNDTVSSGTGNDLIFGDHGHVTGNIDLTMLPLNTYTPDFTFTSIATQNSDLGGDDLINGGAGDDIIIGGQGYDRILGGSGDDDIVGGHTIADGQDTGDWIDGGAGNDTIAGDNAYIHREPRIADTRFRTLEGDQILNIDGNGTVTSTIQVDPSGTAKRAVTLFNHTTTTIAGMFGNDAIAGGSGHDTIFGQLGNDAIQGDGAVVNAAGTMVYNVGTRLFQLMTSTASALTGTTTSKVAAATTSSWATLDRTTLSEAAPVCSALPQSRIDRMVMM